MPLSGQILQRGGAVAWPRRLRGVSVFIDVRAAASLLSCQTLVTDHEKHWFHGHHIPAMIRLFSLEKNEGSLILSSVMLYWLHKSNLMHICLTDLKPECGKAKCVSRIISRDMHFHTKDYSGKSLFGFVYLGNSDSQKEIEKQILKLTMMLLFKLNCGSYWYF